VKFLRATRHRHRALQWVRTARETPACRANSIKVQDRRTHALRPHDGRMADVVVKALGVGLSR
jgi:hypothetical protein